MKRRYLAALFILSSALLFAQEQKAPPPPEVVEKQLQEAESEFERAQKMFNPWYSGPIVTGSAHVMKPGKANIQPYLFVTDNYARYDAETTARHIPDFVVINPFISSQIGIISWMSCSLGLQWVHNKQSGQHATNVGDTSFGLNFALLKETPYKPAIRLSVTEAFPTGHYQHFDPKKGGVASTGAGSYQTTFTFNVSKIVWWIVTHPMNFRTSLNYTVLSHVHVEGFNTYGGGFGTKGTVRPGSSFTGNLGYEFSFTQNWAFALDAVYSFAWANKFSGKAGVTSTGAPATVGGPFSESFSLAPAIEYNPYANLSFIAGPWFTVWGKNTLDYISGIFSFSYTF